MSNVLETMNLNTTQKRIALDIVKQLSEEDFSISEAKEIIEALKVFLDDCKFTTTS